AARRWRRAAAAARGPGPPPPCTGEGRGGGKRVALVPSAPAARPPIPTFPPQAGEGAGGWGTPGVRAGRLVGRGFRASLLPEPLAEEVARLPARALRCIAHQLADAGVEPRQAGGVAVLDRQRGVVAGAVVAVAQEPGHRDLRILAGIGADHATHQVDRGDAGADEGVLVAA